MSNLLWSEGFYGFSDCGSRRTERVRPDFSISWGDLSDSPSSDLFLLLLLLLSFLTTGRRRRRRRWEVGGQFEWGSYDEPSLRSWQQLSQPLVLRGVQLITRLCQCHGVAGPPRLNALPALSDKSHQTSPTDTPPFPPLSVIAVFLSSRRCSIPRSLNQLALTRGKAVPVKTVKGEDDI